MSNPRSIPDKADIDVPRVPSKCVEYRVLWRGYTTNFGLWEPAPNFSSYPDLLDAWSSLRSEALNFLFVFRSGHLNTSMIS